MENLTDALFTILADDQKTSIATQHTTEVQRKQFRNRKTKGNTADSDQSAPARKPLDVTYGRPDWTQTDSQGAHNFNIPEPVIGNSRGNVCNSRYERTRRRSRSQQKRQLFGPNKNLYKPDPRRACSQTTQDGRGRQLGFSVAEQCKHGDKNFELGHRESREGGGTTVRGAHKFNIPEPVAGSSRRNVYNGIYEPTSKRSRGQQQGQLSSTNKNLGNLVARGACSQITQTGRGRQLGFRVAEQHRYGDKTFDLEHRESREGEGPTVSISRQCKRYPMGFKRLEELLTKDSDEIIMVLANSRNCFEDLLKSQLRPDLIILIMKLLAKLCEADFHQNKTSILINATEESFLNQLMTHISRMPTEDNKGRKQSLKIFIQNTLNFFEALMNLIPVTACERLVKLFITTDLAIKGIDIYHSIDLSELTDRFNKLHKKYNTMVAERESSEVKESIWDEVLKLKEPPNNFREMSIFPTPEDLSGEPAFIRPNIVKGAYLDEEHYLDVQFRLLREDFVSPLREGITNYVKQVDIIDKKSRRFDNIRIYRNVYFENPSLANDRMGIVVCFDPHNHMKKVIWEQTKRFMYGSLLCFTRDNFANIIFGTVVNRDVKDYLMKGRIVVKLTNDVAISDDLFNIEFTMVESEVYFEPYHMVLKAMHVMKADTFPMKKYIVDVQQMSSSPKYIDDIFDDSTFKLDSFEINLLDECSWPTAEEIMLDESQYKAFRSALTKEFVVIQGPPGTGKTFLGLKVATSLLQNKEIWNYDAKPILVVCYTNHALDQFLEGLLLETDSLVRIGGQSKNDVLSKFNLREMRRSYNFNANSANFHISRNIHNEMKDLMSVMEGIQQALVELSSNHGIVSLSTLKQARISQQHLGCFQNYSANNNDSLFIEWLEEGKYDFDVQGVLHDELNFHHEAPQEHKEDAVPLLNDEDAVPLLNEEDGQWEKMIDDPLLKINSIDKKTSYVIYALTLNKLWGERKSVDVQIADINYKLMEQQDNQLLLYRHMELNDLAHELGIMIRYWQTRLKMNHVLDLRHIEQLLRNRNLWLLNPNDRWVLYKYWVNVVRTQLLADLHKLDEEYKVKALQYEEVRQMGDLEIIKKSLVVGITTTSAARLQPLLQALGARIVIVEEAAEVLESHIVVSLSNKCQHLILIGDHKQLRPSPSVYRLAQNYNFDVSLFERMLKNGMHCECLVKQHRMRPEIAQLVTPSIYPELQNDSSVELYPPVLGVLKNLYFVTHNYHEKEIDETQSRKNEHEANFLLALCRYLLLQGYRADEITILVTYRGQMFFMRSEQRKSPLLAAVKITVVDNFQGEENRIILLSLVRSNPNSNIGFLKIENRVCVALSRAREGFYIIGNMDNLKQSSKIWPKIYETLKQQDAVGPHLTLQCQIHPDQTTLVATQADFVKVAEGGCSLQCNATLVCGHRCLSVCHVQNRMHDPTQFKCQLPCDRVPPACQLEHICIKLCYENCGKCQVVVERSLPCGDTINLQCHVDIATHKCLVIKEVTLPHCNHKAMKPCHYNIDTFPCPHPCPDRLPCGHSCEINCHPQKDPDHLEYKCKKKCTKTNSGCSKNHPCNKLCYEDCGLCTIEVPKKLPCGHVHKVACSMDVSTINCKRKCKKNLPCGHPCPQPCNAECGMCPVKVAKIIKACGHNLQVKCHEEPKQSQCRKPCQKMLKCGHKCTSICSNECTRKCEETVVSTVKPLCGHTINIPCYMQNKGFSSGSDELLSRCSAPCSVPLECEHKCAGTCGECMQGRIHLPCKSKCGRNLICGHSCDVPCAKNCPPCTKKCQYKCHHSQCSRKCGVPCAPCKETCIWSCEHLQCTKRCHEDCNREPCYEPCKEVKECGHPCIGFCGEPCPPLCRICNADEVTEIFFGFEADEDARFVYLEDCCHTIESQGLEMWMKQTDDEIKLKNCPICKSNILCTQRFLTSVKKVMKDVNGVKKKVFGDQRVIEAQRNRLIHQINRLQFSYYIQEYSSEYQSIKNHIIEQLMPVKARRRNILSMVDTASLKLYIDIVEDLVNSIDTYLKVEVVRKDALIRLFQRFDRLLSILLDHRGWMSVQETSDFNFELMRFVRLTQLCTIECSVLFRSNRRSAEIEKCYGSAQALAACIKHYSEEQDRKFKKSIEDLNKSCSNKVLIVEERKMIVAAIGLGQGHWFKCPNGHYYAIGECGGAMEQAKCGECDARIGGTSHRLNIDNTFAPEIDGATAPAWPGVHYN